MSGDDDRDRAIGQLRRDLDQLREDHAAQAREVDELRDRLKPIKELLENGEPHAEARRLARMLIVALEEWP